MIGSLASAPSRGSFTRPHAEAQLARVALLGSDVVLTRLLQSSPSVFTTPSSSHQGTNHTHPVTTAPGRSPRQALRRQTSLPSNSQRPPPTRRPFGSIRRRQQHGGYPAQGATLGGSRPRRCSEPPREPHPRPIPRTPRRAGQAL